MIIKSLFGISLWVLLSAATLSGATRNDFYDEEPKTVYCFQCNSAIDEDCVNIQPNDTSSYHYKPCLDTEKYNGSQPFCRKIVQKSATRNDFYDEEPKTVYCFQCNSAIDEDCVNIQPNDTSSYHYKPCLDTEKYNGSQPFCRKIVQKIFVREDMERVIRKCGWIRHPRLDCYNSRNDDHLETICQCFEEGCNGSPPMHVHTYLTAILLALLLTTLS